MQSTLTKTIVAKIKAAPKEPGVYLFYGSARSPQGSGSTLLYIGKAASLRARLRSYLKAEDPKTQSLHEEATRIEYRVLRSDIEALIEESRLIQELKPKYNILWRDDKSYLYIAFTQEEFPRVFITHKNMGARDAKKKVELVGPFTESGSLRVVMRLLRRTFPYCTCTQMHWRDCLNAQIGKCPAYCCKKEAGARENKREYARHIRAIKAVLQGKRKRLHGLREKEQEALERIMAHREFVYTMPALPASFGTMKRVEAYDMSHLAGKESVGAFTVLEDQGGIWMANKKEYRTFKIRTAPGNDDPRMMEEVITRRLNHPEWPYPNLMIIDGGITQLSAARNAIAKYHNSKIKKIKAISFAKPNRMVHGWRKDPVPLAELPPLLQQLIPQAIQQTHNFVLRFHRRVRGKAFLQ